VVPDAHGSSDQAIRELDRLRRAIKRGQGLQVRNLEERTQITATALAWFNGHRPQIADQMSEEELEGVDQGYRRLIDCADRAVSRSTYEDLFSSLRGQLVTIRGDLLVPRERSQSSTTDVPPDFSGLVADPEMQNVLERRWTECVTCISAEAPLAATVMMGGLLEGLLLAKVNSYRDQSQIFKATSAPRNTARQTLPLREWTLKDYLNVAHELHWISRSARDVGVVLRDYRNYVHPQKELSHGIVLSKEDAMIWWEVAKSVARELL
jgi:hypothetical protein